MRYSLMIFQYFRLLTLRFTILKLCDELLMPIANLVGTAFAYAVLCTLLVRSLMF